jgi:hypothetical protein
MATTWASCHRNHGKRQAASMRIVRIQVFRIFNCSSITKNACVQT